MAFTILCPTCGDRAYHEYWYGGEILNYRDAQELDENFRDVWLRENQAGLRSERWFHFGRCRRWLTIAHDTQTNEIVPL
jgi:heterotetrameric sarcosine oxidase delta subunit